MMVWLQSDQTGAETEPSFTGKTSRSSLPLISLFCDPVMGHPDEGAGLETMRWWAPHTQAVLPPGLQRHTEDNSSQCRLRSLPGSISRCLRSFVTLASSSSSSVERNNLTSDPWLSLGGLEKGPHYQDQDLLQRAREDGLADPNPEALPLWPLPQHLCAALLSVSFYT